MLKWPSPTDEQLPLVFLKPALIVKTESGHERGTTPAFPLILGLGIKSNYAVIVQDP